MALNDAKNFKGMKQILSELEPSIDANSIIELKERVNILCARFLGGAWKNISVQELIIQRLRGGMSNMLFLCKLPSKIVPIRNEPDKVLLRIYFNPETESHLVDESVIFTLLSERHLGPKLYGVFNGGRLEEYIPSRPLSCSEISMKQMSNKIARRIARIHCLELPIWKEPDYICDTMQRWLTQIMETPSGSHLFTVPDIYCPWAPKEVSCTQLGDEIEFLKCCINMTKSPCVFCHNDLQEGNILLLNTNYGNIRQSSIDDDFSSESSSNEFNLDDPHLVLIDFEYASYNYRGFDFANHFIEYTIDYSFNTYPFYEINNDNFPSIQQQIEFFESYIQESEPNLSSDEIRERALAMTEETLPFVAVSHLFWAIWSFLQVEVSPIDFGFAEYGLDRLGLYFANRKHLKNLLTNNNQK